MPRSALILVAALAVPARADSFEEYSGGRPSEASSLAEKACDLDLQLRGAIVTAELRQQITNTGSIALAATLDFDLPRGAVVTGLATRGDHVTGTGLAVPATFRSDKAEARDVLGVDPALLTSLGGDQYRLTLQPIERDHDVTVTTRWSAFAEISDGALRIVLPARTAVGLAVCHGSLHVAPGPGTSVDKIRIDGHELRARDGVIFGLEARPLAIQVDLAFGGKREPVVWTQRESAGDGWTATVATIVAPPARAVSVGAHRALFVIDGSRSMELVGKTNVVKVVRAIAAALPADAEVDAILYDRTAARVLGGWRPADPANVAAIEAAITGHAPLNGSDLARAFELAHQAIADGERGQSMVIVITDGVLGEVSDTALVQALAAKTSSVDVHAVVIDPGKTRSPNIQVLQRPVSLYGGSLVEVGVDELDGALAGVDGWLRPAWLDVALGSVAVPPQLRAGSGGSYAVLQRGTPSLVLTSKDDARLKVAARAAPATAVAALVLARAPITDETKAMRPAAEAAHPYATAERAFAVLTAVGKVAANRRAMIQGGGPYTRLVAIDDPANEPDAAPAAQVGPSAIAAITLERLFRDQLQPKAYACYQRALGLAPELVGTAHFDFHMGRGEVTSVSITGFGDAAFNACLLDAAYQLTPPPPNFDVNADDETIAHYPLTFNKRGDHPFIVLGDADSSSPLDIDAIEGGVPGPRRPIKVDATTPLGGMRPK